MPFTPYHFGPSGFIGLLFRKWLDIPVFVLANVVVDVEVLVIAVFNLGHPIHRYCHTFLIGAVVGAIWGVAAFPLRTIFRRIMSAYRLPYEPSLWKMVLSGILGVWLHVLIDGLRHPDLKVFWPNTTFSLWALRYRYLTGNRLEHACMIFFIAAVIIYGFVTDPKRNRNSDAGSHSTKI
jgi:membrane-bound metal-dependent hydrolase YbcI (DUF457 family)